MLKARRLVVSFRGIGLALAALSSAWAGPAYAYIGNSFLSIPGESGHWRGADYKGWIRAESSDWVGRLARLVSGGTDFLAGDKLWFGGPNAPKPGRGGGKLVLVFGKNNPDLRRLMSLCAAKTPIAELTYAESSDLARPPLELGARPAEFPAFWEYKLKNVVIDDCPVLEGAADQAVVLKFRDIEWLNYDPARPYANKITVRPEDLPPVQPAVPQPGKRVKAWLVTWIAPATTTTDAECPQLNHKPSEADILRYLTAEEAAGVKARAGDKGITYGTDSENRGPRRLSVANFPGVVPDPGLHEPRAATIPGLDLDGRRGVDNQLFRIHGCVPGLRGRRGYANQTPNARRADGNVVNLIEVSGIDDERNDAEVEIAYIYAADKPVRDNAGKMFIPNYTFRPSEDPNFALYNRRFRGRIVDGVVTSDTVPRFQINPGQGAMFELYEARFRIEPQADGSAKVLLGGYRPWRSMALSSGYSEGLFDYQTPALYYAFRRYADGMKNPVTGEFDGISAAFEIDTVPAFLTPAAPKLAGPAQAGK